MRGRSSQPQAIDPFLRCPNFLNVRFFPFREVTPIIPVDVDRNGEWLTITGR